MTKSKTLSPREWLEAHQQKPVYDSHFNCYTWENLPSDLEVHFSKTVWLPVSGSFTTEDRAYKAFLKVYRLAVKQGWEPELPREPTEEESLRPTVPASKDSYAWLVYADYLEENPHRDNDQQLVTYIRIYINDCKLTHDFQPARWVHMMPNGVYVTPIKPCTPNCQKCISQAVADNLYKQLDRISVKIVSVMLGNTNDISVLRF